MPWALILAPRAEKELAGLRAGDQDAVGDALSRLGSDPTRVDLKKLAGHRDLWRLRVGRWRAILRLDTAAGAIYVLRILPRDRAYR